MTPRLLVAWEPRWQSFWECLPAALSSSEPRSNKECSTRSLSPRGTVWSCALHLAVCLLIVFTPDAPPSPVRLADSIASSHIEYIPAETLPAMADASGAIRGIVGARSGRTALHGSQMIRVESQLPRPDLPAEFPQELKSSADALTTLVSLPHRSVEPPAPRSVELPLPQADQVAEISSAGQVVPAPSTATLDRKTRLPEELKIAAIAPPSPSLIEHPKLAVEPSALNPEVIAAPLPPQSRTRLATLPEMARADVIAPPSARSVSGRNVALPAATVVPAPSSSAVSRSARISIPIIEIAAPPSTGTLARHPSPGVRGLLDSLKPQVLIVAETDTGVPSIPALRRSATVTKAPGPGALSGIGIDGAGSGIDRGAGSGSGARGTGNGASTQWRGRGASDTIAGLNSRPGPGGTGHNDGARTGVSIEGNVVNLGEFTGSSAKPDTPGLRRGHSITIVASSNSGGALNRYGTLKSDRVYTVYLPVMTSMVVMEYAERAGTQQAFASDLVAPEPLQVDLTPELRAVRTVIACVVERDGSLKNIRVLESAIAPLSQKLAETLAAWRFRPALRGEEPVAVDALLGFQIDTR